MPSFLKELLPEQAKEKKVIMAKTAGLLYLLSTGVVLLTLHVLPQPDPTNRTVLDGICLFAFGTGLFFLFSDWRRRSYRTFYATTFITLLYIATFIFFSGGASSRYNALYLLLIFWASFFFTKEETIVTASATALFSVLPLFYDPEAFRSNHGTDEIISVLFIFLLSSAVNLLSRQREAAYLKESRSSAERSQFAVQLETLQRISKELSAELELDRLLRMILSEAMDLLKFEAGWLVLWEEEQNAYVIKTVVDLPESLIGKGFKKEEGLVGLMVEARRMTVSEDPLTVVPPIRDFAGLSFKRHIGIPIFWKGEVIGAFNMAGTRSRNISQGDEKLAEMLAQHAAVAIQNARLFKESEEQARRQAVLYKVVRAVSSEMTPQKTLNAMAQIAAESVGGAFAVLLLRNGTEIEPRGAYQVPPVEVPFFSEGFKIAATRETSPAIVSIRERKVVALSDLQKEKEIPAPLRQAAHQFGFGSLIGVPLVSQEQSYGSLVIYFRQARSFTRQEIDLLSALASEAAVAVRHLKWMEERERHFARTEALREIAQEIGAELQLPRILNLVVERGTALLDLDEGAVILRDPHRQEYVVRVSVGYEPPIVGMTVDPQTGITSEAIRRRSTVLIEDYQNFPNAIPGIRALGVQAVIATPIFIKEALIGVLILETKKSGTRFTDEDRQTIDILARHAALAIENARLYEEARSLNEQFALLTKEVSLSRDLDQVFAHLAENLKRQLDYDWFGIALHQISEEGSAEIMLTHTGGPIRGFPLPSVSPSAQSALLSVIRQQQPLIGHDLSAPRYEEDAILLEEGFRSYGIIPVILKGRVIATLSLLSRKRHHFSKEQADALLPLANHLAPFIENARLFEELKKKKQEAEEASRLKSEFVSSVSHELRTPLNAIIGYGSLLLEETFGEINGGQREALTSLHRNANDLLELINNILDLSKIEAGKSELQWEPVNLKSLLEITFENLKPLMQQKGLAFEWDFPENLPVIQSNPLRVRQVILNLLSNAIKFTDRGSIRVSAKESADPAGILLSVQDTGIGMREEDIPTIFDPFRQIDGSLTRQAGGTGLGLAIVKNILEALQGKIQVESRLGVGSTFTVFFPQMEKECGKTVSEVERS